MTIGDVNVLLGAIGGQAMRSITVGHVEGTIVAGLAHRQVHFHDENVQASHWHRVILAFSTTGMAGPVVSVGLSAEKMFIVEIDNCCGG